MKDRVLFNNSQGKKQDVEDKYRNVKFSKNKMSVPACNDSLNAKISNVNFVYATCGKCVLNAKHDMCVLKSRNYVNSMTKMPIVVPVSSRQPKRIVKQSVAKPIRKTVDSESNQKLRNITRKLDVRVSKACSWWYPKFTPFGYTWKPKSKIGNLVEIILFIVDSGCSKHMTGNLKLLVNFMEKFLDTMKFGNDQIAPILGYGDLALHAYFASKRILHQTSVARTLEQNNVVERQNRTLVEAARTMLSAAKVPLFFWAEAIATTCFTQNRSLVIPRHEKTHYHIINDRKPSVKFFHIFSSICYIVRDGENLDKMKKKGDACIFVGYYTQSRAYRVFNKRTRVIVETIQVNFDKLPQMASDHVSFDPRPQFRTRRQLESDGKICMFTLTVSQTEPKNIKEAMADSAWIESMQEELHHFDRLDEGVDFEESFSPVARLEAVRLFIVVGTPMATKHLDADLSGTPIDQMKYRSMVRALMYLTASRPDIMHATCYCARYQAKPGTLKIPFTWDSGGDKLVSWLSKKQDYTSMSSTEAEYVSLSVCCAQVLWMRTRITDYGFHFDKIPMYCDSKAAIAISCNPVQHSRTKHIDVRYHFIKEKVEKGIVELFFVGTEYQLAGLFTKALLEEWFKYLARQLGMRCLTPGE
nr:hypothetical protein [Tanacetum cinerariifolium]